MGMPQLSLYVDAETLKKIEKAAGLENTSISKWVTRKIAEHLEKNWPENYRSLYGSIDDNSFCAETITAPSISSSKPQPGRVSSMQVGFQNEPF